MKSLKMSLRTAKHKILRQTSPGLSAFIMSQKELSVNIFQSTLPNGDTVLRDWLLYSQTTGKVFCVPCCLFQPITMKTNFSTGFNDWKHSNELLKQHEQSQDHRKTVLTYIIRKKRLLQVDTLLFTQYEG